MCVFTDKKVGKTLTFVLVPLIAINTYVGGRIVNKYIDNKILDNSEPTIVDSVNDQAVSSVLLPEVEVIIENENVYEKLSRIYSESGKSIDEILLTSNKDSDLYSSALYMKLKNFNIPDELIKKELDNIMIFGYSYTDTTDEVWEKMFGNILTTVSYEENVMDYYYPLAKYVHYNECSLEHISEYGDGRVTCNSLQEKFNEVYGEESYTSYVVNMIYASGDEVLIHSLERILTTECDVEACIGELNTIYEMAVIPMCVPEDIWVSQFKNLLQTVSLEENVCEVYYKLACYVHMLNCDMCHVITEFGTVDCKEKSIILKKV